MKKKDKKACFQAADRTHMSGGSCCFGGIWNKRICKMDNKG